MEDRDEKKTFKYGSRKEYEAELISLISDGERDSAEYESLMEEYVRFCSEQ